MTCENDELMFTSEYGRSETDSLTHTCIKLNNIKIHEYCEKYGDYFDEIKSNYNYDDENDDDENDNKNNDENNFKYINGIISLISQSQQLNNFFIKVFVITMLLLFHFYG